MLVILSVIAAIQLAAACYCFPSGQRRSVIGALSVIAGLLAFVFFSLLSPLLFIQAFALLATGCLCYRLRTTARDGFLSRARSSPSLCS